MNILEQETGSAGLRQGEEEEYRGSADAAGLHMEGTERYASGGADRAEGCCFCQRGF